MINLNENIKFLNISVRVFGYFAKIFYYGLQFSFGPGIQEIKGLASSSSGGLILKEHILTSSENRGVGKDSEKRRSLVRELVWIN